MTAGLGTFAKVRALHDRTTSAGEKAAAASRMEALARSAGITVEEALSRLDRDAARPGPGEDWGAFAETFWKAHAAGAATQAAAEAPDAPSRRQGLPIYDPNKIECWRDVAEHCWQLDWIVPKAHGGRFLTKDERDRLKAIARQYCVITNATADWIETVLARCEEARTSWRDRGKGGARPDRRATESDIEKALEMVAAAKRREASKLDTPEPPPPPQGPAQAFAETFAEFMNRPEFVAERNEREARRRVEAAAIIDRYGSEDALFADTPMEAALREACEPLLGSGETWSTIYHLDGWGSLSTVDTMPASVREAIASGQPLPTTVTGAWAEFEAADRLMGERCTVEYEYEPHLYVRARGYLLEEILNTLAARSLNDLRARGAWLAFQADAEVSQRPDEHRALIATLRLDIERMGQRLRDQDATPIQDEQQGYATWHTPSGFPDPGTGPTPVQNGHHPDLDGGLKSQPVSSAKAAQTSEAEVSAAAPSVQSGHPRRPTRAERNAAIHALLAAGHTDREVARRLGISPTTVGTVRRSAEKDRTP